ncbi:hypothetical protein [Ramlibacter sp. AN1133]|uniref:hypothetical protein n=1 Tax=Ramlibacter sp. AN1133 TaxID=3133429 RepID=UPI0030C36AA0
MTAPTHGRRAERIRRTATTVGIGNLLAQSWLSPAPRVEPVPDAPAPSSREAEGADARTGAPQRPSISRAI